MTTAQFTPRAQAVIAASDEYTAPIFRERPDDTNGADECQLVGVKADGTQHVLGTVTMPPKMKAREIVLSYFGRIPDEDGWTDAEMALQCCLDLIDFMQKPAKVKLAAIAATAATGEAS